MNTLYIELESISSKRWLINTQHILVIEEKTSFSDSEKKRFPELTNLKSCCIITFLGTNETFWIKNTYSDVLKKLIIQDE